jgi:hypothetical protein
MSPNAKHIVRCKDNLLVIGPIIAEIAEMEGDAMPTLEFGIYLSEKTGTLQNYR